MPSHLVLGKRKLSQRDRKGLGHGHSAKELGGELPSLLCFPAPGPWPCLLTLPCLSFPLCKTGRTIAPTAEGHREGYRTTCAHTRHHVWHTESSGGTLIIVILRLLRNFSTQRETLSSPHPQAKSPGCRLGTGHPSPTPPLFLLATFREGPVKAFLRVDVYLSLFLKWTEPDKDSSPIRPVPSFPEGASALPPWRSPCL